MNKRKQFQTQINTYLIQHNHFLGHSKKSMVYRLAIIENKDLQMSVIILFLGKEYHDE